MLFDECLYEIGDVIKLSDHRVYEVAMVMPDTGVLFYFDDKGDEQKADFNEITARWEYVQDGPILY